MKFKIFFQNILYPTLKKYNFFHVNVKYIYQKTSNLTLKKKIKHSFSIYIVNFEMS
jgi:hypothetical protein